MTYYAINYDNTLPGILPVDLPADPTQMLHACYDIIGCDMIETVGTVIRGLVLVIDESGKLRDNWRSTVNTIATALYGYWRDPIVGVAILASVDGDRLAPPTAAQMDIIRKHWTVTE